MNFLNIDVAIAEYQTFEDVIISINNVSVTNCNKKNRPFLIHPMCIITANIQLRTTDSKGKSRFCILARIPDDGKEGVNMLDCRLNNGMPETKYKL